jgi:archaellum biogenesis protein FlaJ (TadC family)
MELLGKIALAAVLVMMLFYLWPAFKQWQEHGPKAQKGDWQAVALPLALVIGLVILLVALVR